MDYLPQRKMVSIAILNINIRLKIVHDLRIRSNYISSWSFLPEPNYALPFAYGRPRGVRIWWSRKYIASARHRWVQGILAKNLRVCPLEETDTCQPYLHFFDVLRVFWLANLLAPACFLFCVHDDFSLSIQNRAYDQVPLHPIQLRKEELLLIKEEVWYKVIDKAHVYAAHKISIIFTIRLYY